MQLTQEGQQKINDIAQRYGISTDAVTALLQALFNGNGTMAQFSHPELGGSGQWMMGGMTMVGDMFNNSLKATVDGVCSELSDLMAAGSFAAPSSGTQWQGQGGQQQQQGGYGASGNADVSLFVPQGGSGNWWPGDLGMPSSSGSQNNVRYAYFSDKQRLAVEINGNVTVYDTLDHQIGGVSQQQGGGSSVTFTSQYGTVEVGSLPVISGGYPEPPPVQQPADPSPADLTGSDQEADIFAKIQQLAELKEKGILTEEEFTTKKTELLKRL